MQNGENTGGCIEQDVADVCPRLTWKLIGNVIHQSGVDERCATIPTESMESPEFNESKSERKFPMQRSDENHRKLTKIGSNRLKMDENSSFQPDLK